jgi:hypothetical protein
MLGLAAGPEAGKRKLPPAVVHVMGLRESRYTK